MNPLRTKADGPIQVSWKHPGKDVVYTANKLQIPEIAVFFGAERVTPESDIVIYVTHNEETQRVEMSQFNAVRILAALAFMLDVDLSFPEDADLIDEGLGVP